MGSNRAGKNLKQKRKRQLKNFDTYCAAVEKRAAAPAGKTAKAAKAKAGD